MKFCGNCGAEIADEAVVCIKCGCSVGKVIPNKQTAIQKTKFCGNCGAEILNEAVICVKCGCSVEHVLEDVQEKDWLTALLLAIFVGTFGIHRFYVNKIGTGILMLLLCWTGIATIWAVIDIIMLATGSFKDKNGKKIVRK